MATFKQILSAFILTFFLYSSSSARDHNSKKLTSNNIAPSIEYGNKNKSSNDTFEVSYIYTDTGYIKAKLSFTINDSLTLLIKNENEVETYYPIMLYASSGSRLENCFLMGFITNTAKCNQFEKKQVECTEKWFKIIYDEKVEEILGISISEKNEENTIIYLSKKGKDIIKLE